MALPTVRELRDSGACAGEAGRRPKAPAVVIPERPAPALPVHGAGYWM
ncbi:hypothetical protein [Afifella sp. IM 167]|nr:hypothetical protein [Afifella sp. IM 167]